MKRQIPIIFAVAVLLALIYFSARPDHATHVESQIPKLEFSDPSQTVSAQGTKNATSQRIHDAITSAMAAPAKPATTPSSAPYTGSPVSDLSHRNHPLTRSQQAALSRMRWKSPGKMLEWRSASQKPVISFLRAPRLQEGASEREGELTREATTATHFLRDWQEAIAAGPADAAWQLRDEQTDGLGYTQVRFDQRWQGLPVWPGAITVQVAPNGDATLVTGAYAPEPADLSPMPSLSTERAATVARRSTGSLIAKNSNPPELLVFAPLFSPEPHLAYRCEVETGPVGLKDIFVDAHTGEILAEVPLIVTVGVSGSGTDLNGETQSINVWRDSDNRHYMVDTSKSMFDPTSAPPGLSTSRGIISITDIGGNTNINAPTTDVTSSSPNGPWDPHAVSASANLSRVYDFYESRFNRRSVDGQGGNMSGIINLGADNAYSNSRDQSMTFGNRDKYAEALDVVAHEMTHSVISTTSNLEYVSQSGALNEAFSDILGEGCEAHFEGGTPDWLIGTALRAAFRSMSQPSSKIWGTSGRPYPEKMSEFVPLPPSSDADYGGVHGNSSIINFAFYQLATQIGGGIGLDDALQIFYRAVTTKLNRDSQFIDARFGCIESATELFGAGSTQSQRTAQAFDFVEIFDQATTPDPVPVPEVAAQDSTLFIIPTFDGTRYLGRRENALGDDGGGVFLGDGGFRTPMRAGKKPSVRGDGTLGVFVTPQNDAALIDTMSGTESPFGLAGEIGSAAISPDGSVQAYVLQSPSGAPDKRILVFDAAAGESTIFTASQPVTNPGDDTITSSDSILFVDSLDITPDGRYIIYDAVNRFSLPGGFFIDAWSIYVLDRRSGTIRSLFGTDPQFDIGNPSFGQLRPELLTFDVTGSDGVNRIFTANLATGDIRPLVTLAAGAPSSPGWPGFSGDDTAVVYTNYQFNFSTGFFDPYLESQPLQADGQTARGGSFVWLGGSFPEIGLIYRRGSYQGLPQIGVTANDPTASESGNNPGCYRLARNGSTARALSASFVLTGRAANGSDFSRVPLTATIPAGASSVDLQLNVMDDSDVEGDETVTLTLSESSSYTLAANMAANVTIEDNDMDTGYDAWATTNNATGGPGGNSDQDPWTNFMEYALGLNPQVADGKDAIRASIQGGRLIVDVTRASKRPGLTYTVEFGTALNSWSAAGSNVLTDTPTALRTQGTATSRFARLRVTQ